VNFLNQAFHGACGELERLLDDIFRIDCLKSCVN
jgi:hypothetical protein